MRNDLADVAKRITDNGQLYLFLKTLDEAERQVTYSALTKLVAFKVKSYPYVMRKGPQVYGV